MTFQFIDGVRAAAPPPVRPGPGAYGWLTPTIAALARECDDVAENALAMPRESLHFIALTLAMMGPAAHDPDHLAAFARRYACTSRRKLFGEFTRADPRLVKLVKRFAGKPWRAPTYRRLAALYEEPAARKTLAHCPAITRARLRALSNLPPAFRTMRVLKKVANPKDRACAIFAIDVVCKLRPDMAVEEVVASFETTKDCPEAWARRHFERAAFPAPPVRAIVIGGIEAIRPLTSYDDMARSAREFDNCIASYLMDVLRGERYFYRFAPRGRRTRRRHCRTDPIPGRRLGGQRHEGAEE